MTSLPGTQAAAKPLFAGNPDWDFSFHNLIGIVNPLQHLPVIGTLYRAITGDKIGTPEKIAGDALYGGLWGAVSSIADTAFEAATGKNVEDTLLAMVKGDNGKASASPIAVAANDAPAAPSVAALDIAAPALPDTDAAMAASATTPATPDVVALTSALAQKGIDSDTAQRALMAYRRSQAAPQGALLAVAQ